MPKYTVTWRETVSQVTEVEAESAEAAIELVKEGEFDEVQTDFILRDDYSFNAVII